jgi:hypothetical protein
MKYAHANAQKKQGKKRKKKKKKNPKPATRNKGKCQSFYQPGRSFTRANMHPHPVMKHAKAL